MKRTPSVELENEFDNLPFGEVTKSWVDEKTGKRYIVGAASGLEEDKDGERVSKRAISQMVEAINKGGIKVVAGTHEQNWLTEIGEAVEAHIDQDSEQLMVKTEIEPEGVDPIADKAWAQTNKRPMSWSVGGKLRAAYHELTEKGQKRKVLDGIGLKHLCLTDKPAYPYGFASAVAKTWDGQPPADDEFTEEVEKANLTTGSWASGSDGNSGQPSQTGGERNAGTRKKDSKSMSVQDGDEDDDDDKKLPDVKRHLSCPACGHEFAADIPVDMSPAERQDQDEKAKRADEASTGKSKETTMDLQKRIEHLEALVTKTTPGEATPTDDVDSEDLAKGEKLFDDLFKEHVGFDAMVSKLKDEHSDWDEARCRKVAAAIGRKKYGAKGMAEKSAAAKSETDNTDVLKVVAVATGEVDDRLEETRGEVKKGFEILGQEVLKMRQALQSLPLGRKSVARVLPPATGHDEVEKSEVDKLPADASALDVLKAGNAELYGIR